MARLPRPGRLAVPMDLLWVLCVSYMVRIAAADGQCQVSATESLEIGNVEGDLLGVHIRSNIEVSYVKL